MGKSALVDEGAIYTKIFINHLQIVMIVRSFQIQLPQFLSLFDVAGGDPLQLTIYNLDCVFNDYNEFPIYV